MSPRMSEEHEELPESSLLSHLLELRSRLIRAFVAVLVVFVPCAYFREEIFHALAQPLLDKLPKGATLIATTVVSPFMTPFKLAFFTAIFVAMPFVLFQVWAFVAPGLYRREKRFAVPLLMSSILLFYAGVAFAYFVVFPVMFQFFAHSTPQGVALMADIAGYLNFVLTIFFSFGVAFEVPIAVVLLALTGLVSIEKLKSSRGYVLIGVFVIAAFITPPDAISQCIMAVPMYLLYEAGLLMARVMVRQHREAEQTAA
jgi:sec-independent protein translocase protein TatC